MRCFQVVVNVVMHAMLAALIASVTLHAYALPAEAEGQYPVSSFILRGSVCTNIVSNRQFPPAEVASPHEDLGWL